MVAVVVIGFSRFESNFPICIQALKENFVNRPNFRSHFPKLVSTAKQPINASSPDNRFGRRSAKNFTWLAACRPKHDIHAYVLA